MHKRQYKSNWIYRDTWLNLISSDAFLADVQVYRRRLRAHALRRGTVPLREGERAIERYPSDRDRGGSRGQQQDQHYWEGGEEPRDPTKFNQIKYKTVFTKSSITTPNSPAGYSSHVSNEMTAAGSSVLTVWWRNTPRSYRSFQTHRIISK